MISLGASSPSAAHWSIEGYKQIFNSGATRRRALVATDASESLCGFIVSQISSDEYEVENIVVAESNQRTGIGHALLNSVIAAARSENIPRILLEVRESNLAARKLYEHCGLAVASRRKSYYSGPAEDALIYILQL